jgi:hypothetical protein
MPIFFCGVTAPCGDLFRSRNPETHPNATGRQAESPAHHAFMLFLKAKSATAARVLVVGQAGFVVARAS